MCFRPCTQPCSDCVAERTRWCSTGLVHGQAQGWMQGWTGPALSSGWALQWTLLSGVQWTRGQAGAGRGAECSGAARAHPGVHWPRELPCTRSRVHCRAHCRAERTASNHCKS